MSNTILSLQGSFALDFAIVAYSSSSKRTPIAQFGYSTRTVGPMDQFGTVPLAKARRWSRPRNRNGLLMQRPRARLLMHGLPFAEISNWKSW
jgi:hypothetical protein